MVWKILLASWGQLSCLVPSRFFVNPHSLVGGTRNRKYFDIVQTLISNDRNISVFTNTFSSTNLKHSLIPATMKKMDSTPAQTRTWLKKYICFASLMWMGVENSVVFFSFKTDQAAGVCTVYVSSSVQTDCSWTLQNSYEKSTFPPSFMFPSGYLSALCSSLCGLHCLYYRNNFYWIPL